MCIIYTDRMLHELGPQKVIRAPRWLCLVCVLVNQMMGHKNASGSPMQLRYLGAGGRRWLDHF